MNEVIIVSVLYGVSFLVSLWHYATAYKSLKLKVCNAEGHCYWVDDVNKELKSRCDEIEKRLEKLESKERQ